jgi:hypothetical protein
MAAFPLFRCRRGVTMIEFALIAPVLFLLIMGIIEFALVMYVSAILEGATSSGSRFGKTGFAPAGQSAEQYIRTEIQRLAGGFIDLNKLTITILAYDTFSNVGQAEPCFTALCGSGASGVDYKDVNGNGHRDLDMGKADDPGAGGEVVLYRVSYPWPLFTPLIRNFLGDANGNYVVTTIATVRNEPF